LFYFLTAWGRAYIFCRSVVLGLFHRKTVNVVPTLTDEELYNIFCLDATKSVFSRLTVMVVTVNLPFLYVLGVPAYVMRSRRLSVRFCDFHFMSAIFLAFIDELFTKLLSVLWRSLWRETG